MAKINTQGIDDEDRNERKAKGSAHVRLKGINLLTGCWKTAICGVSRPLIPALLDTGLSTRGWMEKLVASQKHEEQSFHTSNRASRCGVPQSTPPSSEFREPCIWPFLINLEKPAFSTAF